AWDNKPPLLYIVYAIFNGDQFYVRALSLIFGLFSVTAFYFLAKKLFGENKEQSKIAMWSAGIFAFLFAIPFMEGNIANSENFMLLLIIFSGFLILSEKLNPKILLISGLILGIAFLFKIVAIFDFTAFAVFIIISKIDLPKRDLLNLNLLKKIFNLLAPFVLGFAIPILITAFFFIGPQFKYFFQATFLQNVGYVGWGNKLIIPQGYMILKLILLAGFTTYLLIKKDKFSKTLLFIIIWFAFSLFNTFFSQRPYTHYLLVLLPSFSLLVGLFLFEKKYKPQLAVFFIISLIFICLGFKFSGKTLSYYQNFASFIIGSKSVREYREFFDRRTPIDYEIATYIKSKTSTEDEIFIWGNNAQIYKMTDKLPPGRYAVTYHIT
ncbi:MAG: glycosyltransferase family 39 protein, partial [Patescibacteria group bacterium]